MTFVYCAVPTSVPSGTGFRRQQRHPRRAPASVKSIRTGIPISRYSAVEDVAAVWDGVAALTVCDDEAPEEAPTEASADAEARREEAEAAAAADAEEESADPLL